MKLLREFPAAGKSLAANAPGKTSAPASSRLLPLDRIWRVAFHAAWITILALATVWRFSLPLVPVVDGDIFGFLNPAISALVGRGFTHTFSQPFIYPGILWLLLGCFQDFRAIVIFHFILDLATGALLLATWCSARQLIRRPLFPAKIHDLLGVAMLAVAMFATGPVQLKYSIRSDSICPFFAVLSILLTVLFLKRGAPDPPNSALKFIIGGAALFTAFFLAILKPSFTLSAIFATIPILFGLLDRSEKLTHRILMVAIAVPAILFLLILPERHLAQSDPAAAAFFPQSIFSIHALIIREQIAADIAVLDPDNPYTKAELQTALKLLDSGITASRVASPEGFPSIGYDADQLLHHGTFFGEMAAGHRAQWALGFYRYYYRRAWRKQTRAMISKVTGQLALFYNLDCPAYHGRRTELTKLYRDSKSILFSPDMTGLLTQLPAGQRYLAVQTPVQAIAPTLRLSAILRRVMEALASTYVPCLLFYLAVLPWILWDSQRRSRFGPFAAFLAIGYGYNFGNNLGIAIFHTLEVSRYSMVQFATTILTQVSSAFFLGEILTYLVIHTLPLLEKEGSWLAANCPKGFTAFAYRVLRGGCMTRHMERMD